MGPVEYCLTGALAMFAGVDRVAFGQFMISRPIVVGPLAGLILGDALIGLEIGMLLELLWLGRLPVGAAIPPDDTQVTLGATVLALHLEQTLTVHGMPLVLLCVLVAIPLGKFGQSFDRLARNVNDRFNTKALTALKKGDVSSMERLHLMGLGSFAFAGLATATLIIFFGFLVLSFVAPFLVDSVRHAGLGLQYSLILVGAASLLGTINVSRAVSLFSAAFTGTLLVMWLK
ncbi:MAG: PTS sugar transporter subunit IIC [Deltaproteobacteria bacterium]|jgi:PTS system mannose-specific IIC component|nr:PTS sugar transporter subunit IIC [Deltaproteobacteria bacterium]